MPFRLARLMPALPVGGFATAFLIFAPATFAMEVEGFAAFEAGTVVAGDLPQGGSLVVSPFADFQLSVVNNGPGPNSVVVFDSADPDRYDRDLGSPNQTCGGPGVGAGGESGAAGENCEPLGNLLIIPVNLDDADLDDRVDAPNDEAAGGVISFDFHEPAVVHFLTLIDVDQEATFLKLLTTEGGSELVWADDLGNNSVQTLDLQAYGLVHRLDVCFGGSGGVARIGYEIERPLPVVSTTWGALKHGHSGR